LKTIIKEGLEFIKKLKNIKKYPISKSKGNTISFPGKMGVKWFKNQNISEFS